MNKDDVIRMAREAGLSVWLEDVQLEAYEFANAERIKKFAALVTEAAIKDAPDYKMGYADGAEAERRRLASAIEAMPFGDTAASFAIWIRDGGKA